MIANNDFINIIGVSNGTVASISDSNLISIENINAENCITE